MLCENARQAEVINDIEFPTKVKNLEVDAEVRDVNTEILPDKVIVTGTIHVRSFVAGETKNVDGAYYKEGEVFERP